MYQIYIAESQPPQVLVMNCIAKLEKLILFQTKWPIGAGAYLWFPLC